MTIYTDVDAVTSIVTRKGVSQFINELIVYLTEDFRLWPTFDKSARTAAHSDVGVIELMPIANDSQFAFKYVNGHPNNERHALPTVMAFGVLAEVETGYPILLSELTLTTALRTAATSVMAARLLARNNSEVMALIGCGAQSEFQAIAFNALLGIKRIKYFDIDDNAMAKFKDNLSSIPGLTLIPCKSAEEACIDVDIITTVTADKKYATIITPDMVAPGVHINGVGGDCPGKTEIAKGVLLQADIFVEYEPQSRVEGDIQQLDATDKVTELWQVLTGEAKGRTNEQQITFFDSVGFALEDYSALRLIAKLAREFNVGEPLTLIPDFNDPKDLFAFVK